MRVQTYDKAVCMVWPGSVKGSILWVPERGDEVFAEELVCLRCMEMQPRVAPSPFLGLRPGYVGLRPGGARVPLRTRCYTPLPCYTPYHATPPYLAKGLRHNGRCAPHARHQQRDLAW